MGQKLAIHRSQCNYGILPKPDSLDLDQLIPLLDGHYYECGCSDCFYYGEVECHGCNGDVL